VSREYPPFTAYSGGIGAQFRALSVELARAGHDVQVMTLGGTGPDEIEDEGVLVRRLALPRGGRARALRDDLWARTIDVQVNAHGPFDTVYAPEWAGEASRYCTAQAAGPLITNLTSPATVVYRAWPGWNRSPRRLTRLALQGRLERRQAERSRALVACSGVILDRVRKEWSIDSVPTRVIPNCIDVRATQALAAGEPPEGFPADGPVVAFSGRLQAPKGADVLVEAMRPVWDRMPEARLVMLGPDTPNRGGTMGDTLVRLAGEHRGRLHLLGNQPRERLFPALARADVVAQPSRWDSFPLAALEAMALGRALVVTEGMGFAELASPGEAMFAPAGDAAAVGDAILRLLEDPDARARVGAAARERAADFDVAPVTLRHVEMFETVAGA
jgi:glycosyltransferase involved in cell wall biosynthesis